MFISVPPDICDRCLTFGHAVVASYAAGKSAASKSLRVVGKPPIFDDPVMQGYGKVFECAFCVACEIDVDVLNWTAGVADSGFDVQVGNVLVDVKGSPLTYARFMPWPASKLHFLDQIPATHFVFVRREAGELDGSQHVLCNVGWGINVGVFREEHWVSTQNSGKSIEKNMAPNTPYMLLSEMENVDPLIKWVRRYIALHGEQTRRMR